MKKVFIVHGFQGRPNSNWFPWLMEELSKESIYACVLPMPTPDAPIKREWVETINEAVGNQKEETFLVGHSLGVPAILRYLESLDKDSKIGGVVLVSGPVSLVKEDGYESVNKFIDRTFDFDHIKNVCKYFIIIHGDNDTNVPFSDAEELSKKLEGFLISIPNGGHLNGSDGFYKLPEVLDSLLKIMKISK
ncbi:serine hydrolase family protein [Candidatus Nomurabacteria bacterium]|nr:serine hydrolase family protein [Candidatus Nomurabacteria bacterium]